MDPEQANEPLWQLWKNKLIINALYGKSCNLKWKIEVWESHSGLYMI